MYIKEYKGCPYPEKFPGNIKALIVRFLDQRLKDLGYPDNLRTDEKSKISTYLGRALTYARKKVEKQENNEK